MVAGSDAVAVATRRGRALTRGGFTHVLVWDPILAALYRFAWPPGVELVWVLPPPEGRRLYQRLMRHLSVLTMDRIIVSHVGQSVYARAHETVVLPPTKAEPIELLDAWVVLASDRPPSAEALAALARRAKEQPAAAVLLDSRDHDQLHPDAVEVVRSAAEASRVWWVGDREWMRRLGGVPRDVVDPSAELVPDHRHHGALACGARVLALATATAGSGTALLASRVEGAAEWIAFTFRDEIGGGVGDRDWAAAAFPRTTGRDALVDAVPVRACPMCTGIGRRIVAETDAGTFVVRCARCQLHRASHVAPALAFSDGARAGEHSARSTDRLDVLAPLGIVAGRVLDLEATIDRDTTGPFDVVVLGRTLSRAADPVGALRGIREGLLAPGGHVVIDVPNVKSLARVRGGSGWSDWRPGEYHTYPDDWSLRQMLYQAGFQAKLVRTLGSTADWPGVAAVLRAPIELVDRLGYGPRLVAVGQAQ